MSHKVPDNYDKLSSDVRKEYVRIQSRDEKQPILSVTDQSSIRNYGSCLSTGGNTTERHSEISKSFAFTSVDSTKKPERLDYYQKY